MSDTETHSPPDSGHNGTNGESVREASRPALPPGRPSSTPPMLPPPARKKKKHTLLAWLVFLVLFGAAGYVGYYYWTQSQASTDQAAAGKNRKNQVVLVVAEKAKQGDLPIYLVGDGTVTALNTVLVRTRVDGQLVAVNFKEGQDVHKDDLLVEIDPKPFEVMIEQLKAQKAKDESILANAKLDLGRYQQAVEAVTRQQLDTAQATVTQNEAAIKSDQAAIDAEQLQLSYTKITSPIDGRIGLRNVDIGNQVHATDVNGLATVVQVHPITVIFTLSQDTVPQVEKAMSQQGEPTVLAFDSGLTRQLATGKLTAIDNQIDVTSGTYKLKATFDNEDNMLFPNEMVNVRLLAETHKGVVLVPTQAVQRNQQAAFVFVAKGDDTVEMRSVTLGPTEGAQTEIDSGLAADEEVVTDGLDRLQDGTKVKVQSPEEAKAASQAATQGGHGAGTRSGGRGGRGKSSGTTKSAPATAPAEGGEGG